LLNSDQILLIDITLTLEHHIAILSIGSAQHHCVSTSSLLQATGTTLI